MVIYDILNCTNGNMKKIYLSLIIAMLIWAMLDNWKLWSIFQNVLQYYLFLCAVFIIVIMSIRSKIKYFTRQFLHLWPHILISLFVIIWFVLIWNIRFFRHKCPCIDISFPEILLPFCLFLFITILQFPNTSNDR